MGNNNRRKISVVYRLFKTYLRSLHNHVYYSKTYIVNPENIPSDGTPLLIVSNHQNCLNDPLGILFTINDRKINFIARADVFAISPIANKFLRSIGLLPAFRMNVDGEATLSKNDETFKVSEQALIDGNTVVMFPEAGHQDKHWLGNFSLGYTKLAFEAAEMGGFEKDVQILPSCNHYSHYFGIRNQFMVKFGTPISLQPYYELYKTKPRTAQREVNKLVRAQIESLMLNITDLDNYAAIDFARNTYGVDFAQTEGLNPNILPQKLIADQALFSALENAKQEQESDVNEIYATAQELKQEIEKAGLAPENLYKKKSTFLSLLTLIGQFILLPLWLVSMVSAGPIYGIAELLFKKNSKDRMFEGTFLFAISALFTIPLTCLITLILGWSFVNVWFAIAYVLITPLLLIFAWNYKETFMRNIRYIRYNSLGNSARGTKIKNLHNKLYTLLNKITKKNI